MSDSPGLEARYADRLGMKRLMNRVYHETWLSMMNVPHKVTYFDYEDGYAIPTTKVEWR